jgi:hypothetical protein
VQTLSVIFLIRSREILGVRRATTRAHDVSSPYVRTTWRRNYDCCADGLRRRRRLWSSTSSPLTHGYVGSLLQPFFCYAALLMVMIHYLLIISFLRDVVDAFCISDGSLPDRHSLPSVWNTWQRPFYTRQKNYRQMVLCRVFFRTLSKEKHSVN